jgi:hypothetical protein
MHIGVNIVHDTISDTGLILACSFDQTLCLSIDKWLAAPDPSLNHRKACDLQQSGTGQWFLQGEQFKQWEKKPKSFLWLHGIRMFALSSVIVMFLISDIAGCGKSILW